MKRYRPLKELFLARMREFIREPEALFWTYGFPLLLAIGLGIAFRNPSAEKIFVDVEEHPLAAEIAGKLNHSFNLAVAIHSPDECRTRMRLGKSSLIVIPGNSYTYLYDPTRPESALACARVNDILQRASGRRDPVGTKENLITEPGSRYIDFLVPGLLGLNLLGSGMWGIGFSLVDMRVRKLLKRYVATPMSKTDFLLSLTGGRLIFMLSEIAVILGAGVFLFQMRIQGNLAAILLLSLLGSLSFSGLGLLVASRARQIETVSGLINLVTIPMWLLSGTFFSAERFPEILQPLVQSLPLTQLNYALRAVILEGASLASQGWRIAILAGWGAVSFLVALRWFRWN